MIFVHEKIKRISERRSYRQTNKKYNFKMKSLQEHLNNINEARQESYQVQFIGPVDIDGMPFSVTVTVDRENARAFQRWMEDEQDNIVAQASGNTNNWEL